MAYHTGDLSTARLAFLAANGYVGTQNDMQLAWLAHNSGLAGPSVGSVTHVGTGTSVLTPSVHPAGTAVVSCKPKVKVTVAAATLATLPPAQVLIAMDGVNYLGPFVVPSSGILDLNNSLLGAQPFGNTRIRLTFAAGSLVLNDTYAFTVVGLTTLDLNGGWYQFLAHAGFSTGSLNDRKYAYFTSLGLNTIAGAGLSDMEREFWAGSYGPT